MIDICNLSLYFITEIVKIISVSPFMFLVGVAITIAILNSIFNFVSIFK